MSEDLALRSPHQKFKSGDLESTSELNKFKSRLGQFKSEGRVLRSGLGRVRNLIRQDRKGLDLFGPTLQVAGAGVSRAGGYAHAKQYRRMKKVLKRQRTILGRVMRDLERRLPEMAEGMKPIAALWLERARRIHTQRPKDTHKLYALHAPEVKCIGKGKARQPYDGHTLTEQIEQATILMQDVKGAQKPHTTIVDLGYRGVEVPGVEIIHRGRIKSLTTKARRLLKRCQAVEPVIGHLKDDCGLRRNWLKGSEGDVMHLVLCAAGYNLRWLMRAIVRLGLKALYVLWLLVGMLGHRLSHTTRSSPGDGWPRWSEYFRAN